MNKYENLKRVAMHELEILDKAYADKTEFSEADMKKFDCVAHGLKCLLTATAMMEAEEPGYSERRGRSPETVRYISRDAYYDHPDMHYPRYEPRYELRW